MPKLVISSTPVLNVFTITIIPNNSGANRRVKTTFVENESIGRTKRDNGPNSPFREDNVRGFHAANLVSIKGERD